MHICKLKKLLTTITFTYQINMQCIAIYLVSIVICDTDIMMTDVQCQVSLAMILAIL